MKTTKSFIIRALVCLLAVMMLVPVIVGRILDKTGNAINAEYLFIGLAVCSILLAFLLSRASDAKPELALDERVKK